MALREIASTPKYCFACWLKSLSGQDYLRSIPRYLKLLTCYGLPSPLKHSTRIVLPRDLHQLRMVRGTVARHDVLILARIACRTRSSSAASFHQKAMSRSRSGPSSSLSPSALPPFRVMYFSSSAVMVCSTKLGPSPATSRMLFVWVDFVGRGPVGKADDFGRVGDVGGVLECVEDGWVGFGLCVLQVRRDEISAQLLGANFTSALRIASVSLIRYTLEPPHIIPCGYYRSSKWES
ncbi:hypothetical protein KC358_g24 [Hortaea werneckii]|nr:hypothetical protein KC358_g24 [Hortaea werneckii]